MAECSHITPQHNTRKDTGSRPRKGPFLLGWKLHCPCDFQAAPTLSPQLHSLGAGELLCEQTPNTAELPSSAVPPSQASTATCLRTFLFFFHSQDRCQNRGTKPPRATILSSGLASPHFPSHSHGDTGAGLRAQPDPGHGSS